MLSTCRNAKSAILMSRTKILSQRFQISSQKFFQNTGRSQKNMLLILLRLNAIDNPVKEDAFGKSAKRALAYAKAME